MGRGATMYCRTCKAFAYVGYGSGSTWLDGCKTLAEFNKRVTESPHLGTLRKNLLVRDFLALHDGHEVGSVSEDWTDAREGRVYELGSYGSSTNHVIIGSVSDGWRDETPKEGDK